MNDRGIGYDIPGSNLFGLIVVTVLVGVAIVVALAPVRLLEGEHDSVWEAAVGMVGLGVWMSIFGATLSML